MAAFPNSVKTFTTKLDGAGNTIFAAHVNDLQDEVNAIEDGLRNGTAPLNSSNSTFTHLSAGNSTFGAITGGNSTFSALSAGNSTITAISLVSGQIAFPGVQNPSAAVNVLDDYVEGTWVPTLTGASGGSGQVYTVQQGYFVKIGQLVHVSFRVTVSAQGTSSGSIQIGNLPFSVLNQSGYAPTAAMSIWVLATPFTWVTGYAANGTSVITLGGSTTATIGPPRSVVQADLSSAFDLNGSLMYRANA